jgi:hypothetical protein
VAACLGHGLEQELVRYCTLYNFCW